jgi:hypothetical protein
MKEKEKKPMLIKPDANERESVIFMDTDGNNVKSTPRLRVFSPTNDSFGEKNKSIFKQLST